MKDGVDEALAAGVDSFSRLRQVVICTWVRSRDFTWKLAHQPPCVNARENRVESFVGVSLAIQFERTAKIFKLEELSANRPGVKDLDSTVAILFCLFLLNMALHVEGLEGADQGL